MECDCEEGEVLRSLFNGGAAICGSKEPGFDIVVLVDDGV